MNRKVTGMLFNKMRLLGSKKARAEQYLRISRLLGDDKQQATDALLAKEFGFTDAQSFKNSISILFKSKMALEKRYSNYQTIGKQFEAVAYNKVISQLEIAASNTQSSVAIADS